jgi:uncharacterized membrane protein
VKITGRAATTINRPTSEVWNWVADPTNLPVWAKDVDDPGVWLDDGGPTVGSRYRVDYNYGRQSNEIVFEIVRSEPGKSFAADTVTGKYPILVEYEFEEANDGASTNLKIVMNARSDSAFTAVLFILTGWFAKSFMNRRLANELENVKNALESN